MALRSILGIVLRRYWFPLILGGLAFLFLWLRLEPRPLRVVRLPLPYVKTEDYTLNDMQDLVISPDGRAISIRTRQRYA